jgi:chloramphenicol O-acetyltransferase type B
MGNTYQTIDLATWKRKDHCALYKEAVQPNFCVTFELDITNFKRRAKERNLAFSMAFIFGVTKCANEIEEFRYRFLDDGVVLYDCIDPSFTYLDKKTDLFKVVNVPMQDTVEKFIQIAIETAENQKEHFTGPVLNDVYQFSALPWFSFTQISHTYFGIKDNAQPIFAWGKYFTRDGKHIMPFSVQVHHSFVDGFYIGQLANKLQRYLDEA